MCHRRLVIGGTSEGETIEEVFQDSANRPSLDNDFAFEVATEQNAG